MTGVLRRFIYQVSDGVKEGALLFWLWLPLGYFFTLNRSAVPVVASLTSYPQRIKNAWIGIETLLRQSVRPQALILVLSTEEFPNHEVPRRILDQKKRGLSILWVESNGRSYDKLIPVRGAFPGSTIVTFDDDKYFPRGLLSDLFEASQKHPEMVVGSRGWKITISTESSEIHYGEGWMRAFPGEKGDHLLTPGGNGCLYPYESLSPLVDDLDRALEICPTADDIWFWGALKKQGTKILCLGMPPHRPVGLLRQTRALSQTNETENDIQFQRALKFFSIEPSDITGER